VKANARAILVAGAALLVAACGGGGSHLPAPSEAPFWAQWGANPSHTGAVPAAGQGLTRELADIVYDPFVEEQITEAGFGLLTHYQAPIVDGNDVYIMEKGGQYVTCSVPRNWRYGEQCGPNVWHTMTWSESRYSWILGALRRAWTFESDWKPPPNGNAVRGWEPVFHPLDANGYLYVPGAGGTVWRVNKRDGTPHDRIDPFAGTGAVAANTFVAGPLSADANGNVYYSAIELVSTQNGTVDPWLQDVVGAWLVKVTPAGDITKATFASLVPDAPAADAIECPGAFTTTTHPLPWPPDPAAFPADIRCGAQRPGINVAPAIAADGTIYVVSRAHFVQMAGYLVAVNPDLTPKWAASLQHRLNDGCGVRLPIAPDGNTTMPSSCRYGTTVGVDPTTNQPGSGRVNDAGTSSPTVLPDGSVLYGALSNYNASRGHLMRFSSAGAFLDSYGFGWDITPAVWEHDGTYSIVVKENHYVSGMYCGGTHPVCAPVPEEYFITQLDANLGVEWRFKSTSDDPQHPNGYEWCINMPAIDAGGIVYVNSEDGRVYALPQGNTGDFTEPLSSKFLTAAIGAAYTPLALGPEGRVYTQNFGHLFVIGD
jgi:hypothetical protein